MGEIVSLVAVRRAHFVAGKDGPRSAFLAACYGRVEIAERTSQLDAILADLQSAPSEVTASDLTEIKFRIRRRRQKLEADAPPPRAA
jgi:hypothetical protein